MERDVTVLTGDEGKKFRVKILGIDGLTEDYKDHVEVIRPQDNGGVFVIRYRGEVVVQLERGLPDVAGHEIFEPSCCGILCSGKSNNRGVGQKLVIILQKVQDEPWAPIWSQLFRNRTAQV